MGSSVSPFTYPSPGGSPMSLTGRGKAVITVGSVVALLGVAAGAMAITGHTPAAIYTRDPSRPEPHNLYTTTTKLWAAGKKVAKTDTTPPKPVFTYADSYGGSAKKVSSVHLPFSSYSDVYWKWSRPAAAWLRSH